MRLKSRYGLTLHEYDDMLEAQGGVCAICGEECPQNERLSVDHDHETGRVRGLLCVNCNHMLGSAKDSTDTLAQAIEYLKEAE